jgi:hypothetical protein
MTQPQRDERRSPRAKVFLSAVLEWPDRVLPVILRDLSEHGALVETTGAIPTESEVLFCRKDLRVRGYVAWVEVKSAGISFGRPLKSEVVLRHINRPAPRADDDTLHRRPGVKATGMSAEERGWFDDMNRESRGEKGR